MSKTGQRGLRIGSVDEMLALAQGLQREAPTRYRELSARMAQQGNNALAAQFEALARLEDQHVRQIAERAHALLGREPDPVPVSWDQSVTYDEEEARRATFGAYQALAFAVRNEERAFAFYTYVAAEAESAAVRALAEQLARDELEHAAILRHHRRRAFRVERPVGVEIPQSVDALHVLARRWDGEAAAAHFALAKALDGVGAIEDAAIFRRLATAEGHGAGAAIGDGVAKLRSAADGLRLLEEAFDRFALIGERSDDERVVAEAQRLASEMIARLALAGGARSNALLGASPP